MSEHQPSAELTPTATQIETTGDPDSELNAHLRDTVVIHQPENQEHHEHQIPPEDIRRVVLVCVDASEHSVNAFNWSLKNFLRKETDLVVLVTVRHPANIPGPYGMLGHPNVTGTAYIDFTDAIAKLEDHNRQQSHALLKRFGSVLKGRGIACKAIAVRGDPRYDIVRKANDVKAEAVIMGSRGMGAIKRTLLGSVSDYCVHHLNVPVIIVKMQHGKAMGAPPQ